MPRTDHDPVTLRKLLEGAYDRIEALTDELESARTGMQSAHDTAADSKTRQGLLEADLQQAKSRGDRLAGVVREIVNHPTSQRASVQGRLLVALEIWDGRRP